MTNLVKVLAVGAIVGAVSFSAAQAATVGFQLDGQKKNRNFSTFSLTNTSTDAQIESASMTIGKKTYNFDILRLRKSSAVSSKMIKGDKRNGKKRFNEIAMAFNGFDAGESTKFRLDIDRDKGKRRGRADYAKVLFRNGKAKNSLITVTFSNGEVLSTFLTAKGANGLTTRLATGDRFRTLAGAEMVLPPVEVANLVASIPLPAAMPLMLGGLFGIGMVGRRRKV